MNQVVIKKFVKLKFKNKERGFMYIKMLVLISMFSVVLLGDTKALAVTSGSSPVRVVFGNTNVSTSAYTELVHSTVKGLSGVSVLNTGTNPVALAFGPAGSEVQQIVVPNTASSGSNNNSTTPIVPVYYPLTAGYGVRLSVISLTNLYSAGQINSTGELQVNQFYN